MKRGKRERGEGEDGGKREKRKGRKATTEKYKRERERRGGREERSRSGERIKRKTANTKRHGRGSTDRKSSSPRVPRQRSIVGLAARHVTTFAVCFLFFTLLTGREGASGRRSMGSARSGPRIICRRRCFQNTPGRR